MLPVIVTLPAVVQLPDQPANVDPEAGVAVKVTAVPLLTIVVQVLPQLIPEGLLVTVPVPVPVRVTVSVYVVIIEYCRATYVAVHRNTTVAAVGIAGPVGESRSSVWRSS
jgi:hypothetical protein